MTEPRTVDEHLDRLRKLLQDLPPADELTGPTTSLRLIAEAREILRALPEDYVAALPKDLQEKIRRRLAKR